jgi:hypothetical protein
MIRTLPRARWGALVALLTFSDSPVSCSAQDFTELDRQLQADVRPLLRSHCVDCHSTDKSEGELDLERFVRIDDVRRQPRVWIKVAEMLDNGEMPPKDARPLSPEQKQGLRAWIDRYLKAEGQASAGDPGPVVLRRLSNAEYTYTVRDLTGAALDPAREFPVDGAGGEGFTNAGAALVMSPALFTKYLDAAKEISQHAVLLPDGFRFSGSSTPSDWTNEILAHILDIYRRYSDSQGATRVNLQGIVFDTNDGGRLPIEKYLAVTLSEQAALRAGPQAAADVARRQGLSPKYLTALWSLLNSDEPSPLLDDVRRRWRAAQADQSGALAAEINRWQNALTRFQSVGHMRPWVVPTDPLVPHQELRIKIPAGEAQGTVTLFLAVGTAGDGKDGDVVVWHKPRIVTPGLPDLMLKDVRDFTRDILARRERVLAATSKALAAAAAAGQAPEPPALTNLARQFDIDEKSLAAWFGYLGIGADAALKLDHFTERTKNVGGYDFITGWVKPEALSIVANSSDQAVRIPGNMKPHAVAVHPSPSQQVAVGWHSPIAGTLRVSATVTHAHPECGNGVTWSLELRRGATRQRRASGVSQGGKPVAVGPVESLNIRPGDLVSLLIGPRDGNHSCDLTDIEFTLTALDDSKREWDLTKDVSANILATNPRPDRFGNEGVWHFYSEPVADSGPGSVIPAGSLLARWQAAATIDEKARLAEEIQRLLTGAPPEDAGHPDTRLHRQLTSLGGPLFAGARAEKRNAGITSRPGSNDEPGLDPALFGKHPSGGTVDADSLCLAAPAMIEVRLPVDLVADSEFVATAMLAGNAPTGSVQMLVATQPADNLDALRPDVPIIAAKDGAAWQRFNRAFDEFRQWFPAALCYTRIVPVDEVITLTLFHREDEPLCRLMLDDDERQRLDRLWDELRFVSRDAFKSVDAYLQLMEYATQDRPDLVVAFEVFRKPINDRAAAFRQALLDAEPLQLEAVLRFASQAYRRPLRADEAEELQRLYRTLRSEELEHEDAVRFLLARILVSPAFLYRVETPGEGTAPATVSDWELASRLSYFLWSSMPDAELREAAASGRLRDPDVLSAQGRRLLRDERVRRLALEFGCQWLHIYDFAALDEKSERHFPEFAALKDDMHEEAVRFLTDVFQNDGSIVGLLDADYTFVNEPLARLYGVPDVSGPEWRRIDGWKERGRGGVLGLAATLAKQSGASRTSPILRGNWIAEVLLGEKLPRPPKGVPPLPDDEAETEGLTVRQLTERHSIDERCMACHMRIDPLGFPLEGFDAIGRLRTKDLADRPIDTHSVLQDGTKIDGLDGLRKYLAETRRDAFVRQFCRKLLGYALGRGVQLSDEPLLDEMQRQLSQQDYRFSVAVDLIVRSPQFRMIRGKDFVAAEE